MYMFTPTCMSVHAHTHTHTHTSYLGECQHSFKVFFFFKINELIWLHGVLVEACRIFLTSCMMFRCGTWTLQLWCTSLVVAPRHEGSQFPTRIQTMSLALQGGFFTTGTPEVSKELFLKLYLETTFFSTRENVFPKSQKYDLKSLLYSIIKFTVGNQTTPACSMSNLAAIPVVSKPFSSHSVHSHTSANFPLSLSPLESEFQGCALPTSTLLATESVTIVC